MLTVMGAALGIVLGVAGAVGLARVRDRFGWRRSLPLAMLIAAVVVGFMVVDDRNDAFPWATTALLTAYVVTHLFLLRRADRATHEAARADRGTG